MSVPLNQLPLVREMLALLYDAMQFCRTIDGDTNGDLNRYKDEYRHYICGLNERHNNLWEQINRSANHDATEGNNDELVNEASLQFISPPRAHGGPPYITIANNLHLTASYFTSAVEPTQSDSEPSDSQQ